HAQLDRGRGPRLARLVVRGVAVERAHRRQALAVGREAGLADGLDLEARQLGHVAGRLLDHAHRGNGTGRQAQQRRVGGPEPLARDRTPDWARKPFCRFALYGLLMAWSSSVRRGALVSECAWLTTRKRMGFSRIVDCGSPRGRLSCAEHTAAGGILSFKHKLD